MSKPGRAAQPPASRADARVNRERILAVAREVFAESGPEASLNAIARRAGVGPGTLYRHFPNRQALVVALVRDRVLALHTLAEELPRTHSPDDALAAWLAALLEHARLHHGTGVAALLDETADLGIDCHRLVLDSAAAVLGRARREGTARADLDSGDLVRLVAGVALTTTRDAEPGLPERLLGLVLDAVHRDAAVTSRGRPGGSAA
ncbi:TetR/AcrR family transcriptional regulator [Streptomyces sp. NPDC053367]|uniref:TetR/AcrR family transcriptional regulator n=1 Tax=Streptomyces sp. NPDC053367 TaxID=3365700 RepID=UPI0037CE6632